VIDLKDNVLRIYDEVVPFLAEHQLPAKAKFDNDETDSQSNSHTPQPAAKPSAQASSAPSSTQPSAAVPQFPEESVARLQELGATREEAIGALHAAGGSVDGAASILFNF